MRELCAAFVVLVWLAAPVGAAEEWVTFTDGRHLKVDSHLSQRDAMLLKLDAGAFVVISTDSIETIQRGNDVVFGRQSRPLQFEFSEKDANTAGFDPRVLARFAVVAESGPFLARDESL